MYIDALLAGRQFAGTQPENQKLRERLSEEYDRIGGERMLERLREVDPDRAALLASTDRRRIIRALEVHILTGRSITEHDEESRVQLRLTGLCTRYCPLLTVQRSIGASKSGWTACAKAGCLRKRRCHRHSRLDRDSHFLLS